MGPTKYDFSGQTAVVTGAAVGIGKGIAEALAGAGARVHILDINDEKGEAAAEGIRAAGGQASFLHCDVTVSASVRESFEAILAESGRIDILVNNAGGFWKQTTTAETSEDDWDHIVELNLKSVFLCSKAAAPAMKKQKGGRIINLGSMAGVTTLTPTSPPYSAAKAGVHALSRVLAFELGRDGITVNAIAPGTTATERVLAVRNEEQRAQISAATQLGRIGEVSDMVGCALFLASPEGAYMTGQTLTPNGGRFMA